MTKEKIKKFKQTFNINKNIIGIQYSSCLPKKYKKHKDTACTALARALHNNEEVVIGGEYKQLCRGADYFLNLKQIKEKEVEDVYLNQEHIFQDKKTCIKFIKSLPRVPEKIKNKYIIIEPIKPNKKYNIIILLINPAQASRIIGLFNYKRFSKIEIIPNQPTCLSLFAPLATKKPHLNLIDYYDRYYQGKINNKLIFPDESLIISLTGEQFNEIVNNLDNSAQGNFTPKIKPTIVDKI